MRLWPCRPGQELTFNAFMRDITERKLREERVTFMAYHDQLTAAQPDDVEHHLDLVLAGASHDGTAAPLLYLDVDTFKHVNGRFGHDADDELLKEVARRLRVAARASDLVVRLGGDEFVIVLGDVPAESAAAVAEGVARRVCQAFERPFDVGGGFTTSSSIGIGLFPADAHDAKEPAQLGRPGDVRLQAGRPRGLDVRLRRHARRVRRYTPPPWESPRHPPGGRSSPWPCCWERLPWSSS